MKTKAEEIAALDAFIATLPADAYLAHWLAYARPHIAQDITNDVFPTATPAVWREQAAQVEKDATARAAEIIATANRRAADILEDANKRSAIIARNIEHRERSLRAQLEKFMETL